MSNHLTGSIPAGDVRTQQGESQTLADWAETHYDAVTGESIGGPPAPTGGVFCTSWESGGVDIKVTTPTGDGMAAHRMAVDAAMDFFPAGS